MVRKMLSEMWMSALLSHGMGPKFFKMGTKWGPDLNEIGTKCGPSAAEMGTKKIILVPMDTKVPIWGPTKEQ